MALYKYSQYLTASTDSAFDAEYKPGATPPHSGIYRCLGCGREVVAERVVSFRHKTTMSTRPLKVLFVGAWRYMRITSRNRRSPQQQRYYRGLRMVSP